MKFLQSEYDSIKELIEARGLVYSEFSFVKKRGTLNIIWEKKAEPFCFYRKKETRINDQMQFEETTRYLIGPKKDSSVSTWEEVLVKFDDFLA